MKDDQLRQVLTQVAIDDIPRAPDLWPAIRARLTDRRASEADASGVPTLVSGRGDRPKSRRPNRVLSPVTLLLTCLVTLVVAGGAYATVPAAQGWLGGSAEGSRMVTYGQNLDMTQTVNGFVVNLQLAYADPNLVMVGYTITAPPGEAFNNLMPARGQTTLTDAAGTILSQGSPGWGASGSGMNSQTETVLMGFEGVSVDQGTHRLHLHLTINAIEGIRPNLITDTIHGPWVFDFSAPVTPIRVVQPDQTVTADNWAVTLERVTVTPRGTWVTLRGAGPDADVELTAGGKQYKLYQGGGTVGPQVKMCFAEHRPCPELWKERDTIYQAVAMEPSSSLLSRLRGDKPGLQEDNATTARWIDELEHAHGAWQLVVRPDPSFTNPIFALKGGPWRFRFVVP